MQFQHRSWRYSAQLARCAHATAMNEKPRTCSRSAATASSGRAAHADSTDDGPSRSRRRRHARLDDPRGSHGAACCRGGPVGGGAVGTNGDGNPRFTFADDEDAAAADAAPAGSEEADPVEIEARIVSTHNHLEDEPWLPVRSIVTVFRVKITMGERSWEILRRYSDFHELNLRLNKVFGAGVVPEFPPKLMMNADEAIAERYLELDAYVRKLLQTPTVKRNHRLLEFLGIAKQGVRYGVRNYEYDSTQSEGNRYIRDDAL